MMKIASCFFFLVSFVMIGCSSHKSSYPLYQGDLFGKMLIVEENEKECKANKIIVFDGVISKNSRPKTQFCSANSAMAIRYSLDYPQISRNLIIFHDPVLPVFHVATLEGVNLISLDDEDIIDIQISPNSMHLAYLKAIERSITIININTKKQILVKKMSNIRDLIWLNDHELTQSLGEIVIGLDGSERPTTVVEKEFMLLASNYAILPMNIDGVESIVLYDLHSQTYKSLFTQNELSQLGVFEFFISPDEQVIAMVSSKSVIVFIETKDINKRFLLDTDLNWHDELVSMGSEKKHGQFLTQIISSFSIPYQYWSPNSEKFAYPLYYEETNESSVLLVDYKHRQAEIVNGVPLPTFDQFGWLNNGQLFAFTIQGQLHVYDKQIYRFEIPEKQPIEIFLAYD